MIFKKNRCLSRISSLIFNGFLIFCFVKCSSVPESRVEDNSKKNESEQSYSIEPDKDPKQPIPAYTDAQKQDALKWFVTGNRKKLESFCLKGNPVACHGKDAIDNGTAFTRHSISSKSSVTNEFFNYETLCNEDKNFFNCLAWEAQHALFDGSGNRLVDLCDVEKNPYACREIKKFETWCKKKNGVSCYWTAKISLKKVRTADQKKKTFRKYMTLACSYDLEQACTIKKKWLAKDEAYKKKLQDQKEAYLQTANGFYGSWIDGKIDRFIESNGEAPSRIVPIGEGKSIYEFVDDRGSMEIEEMTVPIRCTTRLYVRNGKIYRWATEGNAGYCRSPASDAR